MVHHQVAEGETLFSIARSYRTTVDDLLTANPGVVPESLEVGRELNIPRTWPPAAAPGEPGYESPAPPFAEERGPLVLSWPLRGVIYARFGKKGRSAHDGIDLAAPLGTPVHAAARGVVLYAGEQKGYGLIALLEHPDKRVTLYAYAHSLKVRTGERVKGGEVIATVGEEEATSGPHLHFEVRDHGKPVDPLSQLGAIPARGSLSGP